MKRKTLALLLAAALVLTTSACGNADTSNPGSKESGPSSITVFRNPMKCSGECDIMKADSTGTARVEGGEYLRCHKIILHLHDDASLIGQPGSHPVHFLQGLADSFL